MDKFAVVIDESLVKTGATTNKCPSCGSTLKERSYCDHCGTKPFEPMPPKTETTKK